MLCARESIKEMAKDVLMVETVANDIVSIHCCMIEDSLSSDGIISSDHNIVDITMKTVKWQRRERKGKILSAVAMISSSE